MAGEIIERFVCRPITVYFRDARSGDCKVAEIEVEHLEAAPFRLTDL